MVKMIALDTSTTETGYGVFKNGKLNKSGIIKLSDKPAEKRVDKMMSEIKKLIIKHKPEIVVIEDLAVFNNMATNKNLCELIGFVRGLCVTEGIYFDRLAPCTWRKLIAGKDEKIPRKREECKPWDIKKANENGLKTQNDNEADAFLIGFAYKKLFK